MFDEATLAARFGFVIEAQSPCTELCVQNPILLASRSLPGVCGLAIAGVWFLFFRLLCSYGYEAWVSAVFGL